MLTLYHAPMTRSTRIVALLDELGATDKVTVRTVGIKRRDGSGGHDPANPHPEGKVPLLVHDDTEIWESTAIAQYLCELFPDAGLAPLPGDPRRGAYLSWMAWYGAVVEPLIVFAATEIEHPVLHATFRGFPEMGARLKAALDGPYLLGEDYSAADLIMASAFGWYGPATPDIPAVQAWIERCNTRPSVLRAFAADAAAMEQAKAG